MNNMTLLVTISILCNIGLLIFCISVLRSLQRKQVEQQQQSIESRYQLQENLNQKLSEFRQSFDEHQINALKRLLDSQQSGMQEVRQQIMEILTQHTNTLGKSVDKLTQTTEQQLKDISGQVEKRLADGFEKTTSVFTDVVKRLALIDQAQKKITELSTNVVSLQEILSDKQSRGAFGEVQLSGLIRNMLPEKNFSFQHVLTNGKRVDCILFLPEPTGNVAIDAKFPLEDYRRIIDTTLAETERRSAESGFKQAIRRHITAIAEKYIIPGETAAGAVMFIPAEAVFAEIHAHYPELVEFAQQQQVWMVSPTTMMAILTTARAVLKDDATRQQVHIIQEHLGKLSKDFDRFQTRMDNLSRHIDQAQKDVKDVHTSAKKITNRFSQIERVEIELNHNETDALEFSETD